MTLIEDGLIPVEGSDSMYETEEQALVAAKTAQDVLLNILLSLADFQDLFNTACINKGMYRVYKDNELRLVRTVLQNQSSAAWELREWSSPNHFNDVESSQASLQLEYTPRSYVGCHRRDLKVIQSLKALVLGQCYSVIRGETKLALAVASSPDAQRFDDALWRIWSFCQIFGSGKGREDDVTGQLDWLKGGMIAHNQDLTATMNVNLDFEMSSVLLNPPDCFAKGNRGGLNAQQLYDMIEIWSCLTTILQGYHWRVEQARKHGVFDGCEIDGEYTEEQLLEEWTAYVMTLGPAVILEMAMSANDPSPTGFAVAQQNGWTHWTLSQYSSSRTTFLKEPLSCLYEERVNAAAMRLRDPRAQEIKEVSRKRMANMAAEIKLARRASSYKRLPVVDMSMERSMSMVSRHNSTTGFTSMQQQPAETVHQSSSTAQPHRPLNFSVPRPRISSSTLSPPRLISPIVEEQDGSVNIASLQNFAEGVAEDTSVRAIERIRSMGFTREQAREALMLTDVGDGLRVDRAVDLLLKRQMS